MTEKEQLELLKKNILNLSWGMQDAPFRGVNEDTIKGVTFAIGKILEGTEISIATILKESETDK